MKKYNDLIITYGFGDEKNNVNGFHRGIDFRPNKNNDVWAGYPAIIRKMAYGDKEGNYIQLFSKFLNTEFYINIFHLESFKLYKENQIVNIDDNIGVAGNTGNSFGRHIHYEIFTYNNNKIFENVKFWDSKEKINRRFFDALELYNYAKNNGEL